MLEVNTHSFSAISKIRSIQLPAEVIQKKRDGCLMHLGDLRPLLFQDLLGVLPEKKIQAPAMWNVI